MRISAGAARPTTRIWLDDEPQTMVVEADDVEGWVRRVKRTAEGGIAVEGEHVVRETVYGKVRIEL